MKIKKVKDFYNISEHMNYHIDNNMSITSNIFRVGSDSFYSLLKETRELYNKNIVELTGIDKELYESLDIGKFDYYNNIKVPLDIPMLNDDINEKKGEYKGRDVELEKPTRSNGPKKYKVYVKNPDTGNVVKVNFGDKTGGLKAKIEDPKARESYSRRHKCKDKTNKLTSGYWSCNLPKFKNIIDTDYSGYW